MEQKVKERIKMWKRFYAGQTSEVDENSSWLEILLKLNLSFADCIIMGRSAIEKCCPFSFEELLFLGQLPYYNDIKNLIAEKSYQEIDDYFISRLPTGDDIYYERYPKITELRNTECFGLVPIVVATVVYHRPVDFDEDIYVFCGPLLTKTQTCKHLIIRYTDEKPSSFAMFEKAKEYGLEDMIKSVCPKDCQVEVLPTKRRETISKNFDIDDWAIERIHPLHHDKIRPLQNPAGAYRTIYCCGDNFVFYTPFGCVFRKFSGRLNYEVYGDMEYQKYVGNCADVNKLITYLTTVTDVML